MKKTVLFISFLMGFSSAFAGDFTCQSRKNTFVIKGAADHMYVIYECSHQLTNCTPGMVFEALGFEDEGSFTLHGRRSNGQSAMIAMVKAQDGWTATLSAPYGKNLQDILKCGPYKR